MLDVVKIAVKAAAIAGTITAVVVVLALIQIPAVDLSILTTRINNVYSIAVHWCPIMGRLYPLAMTILAVNLGLLGARAGMFAFKAIMTIFE